MKKLDKNLPIGVFDSGIGGLCVLKELADFFPCENFIYFGDNLNAPYGNKDLNTLKALTANAVDRLKGEGVKALVIGCNTLSSNLYRFVKERAGVPVIKTLPPKCKDKNKVLLCTVKTAESNFVKRFFKGRVIGLRNLAGDIEKSVFNLEQINLDFLVNSIPKTASGVVLGCTHYHYVKPIIESLSKIPVEDGYKRVKFSLRKVLKKQKLFKNSKNRAIKFIGESSNFNEKVYYFHLSKG
ncbi:MAG: aspartate/glutamate racemase family protein [Clostridia bacterium]|nr:aspartate/glutamate racemase family protein [Clostridia bacterium]